MAEFLVGCLVFDMGFAFGLAYSHAAWLGAVTVLIANVLLGLVLRAAVRENDKPDHTIKGPMKPGAQ